MLYYILGAVALLVIGLFVKAALSPNTFRVERSVVIHGTPQAIFAILNDFHQSVHWSPWEKKDLNMKQTISGPATGKGAIHEWDGNKDVARDARKLSNQSRIPRLGFNSISFVHFRDGTSRSSGWSHKGLRRK